MIEADFLVDTVLGGGLPDVVQDSRPVGDRLRLGPWLERIAHREHVAVGADAGIAEQIPGAADAVAALENDETLIRTVVLQVIARADAGQPGADDQHIDMFVCGRSHRSLKLPPSLRGFVPAIRVFAHIDSKDVNARHKAGHDEKSYFAHRHSGARAERASPESRDSGFALTRAPE